MDKGEEENQPCSMQVSCGDGDSTEGTRMGNLKRHLQHWHSKEAIGGKETWRKRDLEEKRQPKQQEARKIFTITLISYMQGKFVNQFRFISTNL
jgi:hypothetical protein